MFNQWLLFIQTFLIISTFKSVYTWNPQCSPCRCFDENNKKVSDCSSSVTSIRLTKIPALGTATETLFLAGQQLHTIPQDAFFSGSSNNLKFVDLKNCKVRTVHANAFRNLEQLSGLDLSHNEVSQLDENVFGLNNKLRILILQNNNLQVFPEKIFHNLPGLKYLDFSNNKLHYIYPNQFQSNTNIERLFIQSNYLTNIDQSLISHLRNLNLFYFDKNPWTCNCQAKDLQKLIIDRNIEFVDDDTNYPLCTKPKQWKGKTWLEIKPTDLCSVPNTPVETVSEGETFDVNCILEATNNYLTVEWFFNGQSLDTSNSNKYQLSSVKDSPDTYKYKLTINDVKFADIGVYKCWSSNSKGSDIQYEETILNVTEATKPSTYGPPNQEKLVKNGELNYKLPCGVSGKPTPKAEWFFNGKILTFSESNCRRSKSNDNSIFYSQVNPSCFGNYTCRARNSKGVAEQNYELLPLPQNKPKVVDPVDSNIINNNAVEGTSVNLNCYVAESVLVKVQWLRNGQVISPNHRYNIKVTQVNTNTYNYVLTINDISFNEAGNYKCRANSVESPDFTLNVTPGTRPIHDGPANQDKLVKNGELNYKLPCGISGSPTPTAEWLFNGKILTFSESNCQRSKLNDNSLLYSQVNPSCFGNYICRATNSKGVAEQNYELLPLPQKQPKVVDPVDSNIINNNAVEGTSVNLNCFVAESVLVKVQWLRNGQVISPNHRYNIKVTQVNANTYNYVLTINDISFNEAGNYKCRANSVESPDFTLNVTPGTRPIHDGPANQDKLVKNGELNYKLPCGISGSPTPTAEWLFNGKILTFSESNCQRSKSNDNSLLYSQVNPSCFGNYTCRARNSKGVAEQNYELLPLPQNPPKVVDPVDSNIINNNAIEGTSVNLNCFVAESVLVKVQWLRNGQVISPNHRYNIKVTQVNANTYNYVLTINDISFNEAGNYKCRANSVESPDFTLNVTPGTRPIHDGPANQDKLVKNGELNYKLPCGISGSPTPTAEWLFNGKILTFSESNCQRSKSNDNSLLYSQVNPSCFGNYTCRARNSKGVAEQNYELLPLPQKQPKVVDPVDSNIVNNNAVEGTSVNLNCYVAESVLVKVQWLRNGQIITPNNRYNIKVTQVNANTYNYVLTINDISFNEAGNYKCRANSIESPDYTLNVTPGTTPFHEGPANQDKLVKNGELNYKLPCGISGSPTPTAEWLFNGKILTFSEPNCQRSKSDDNSLLYSLVNPSCFGKYTCRASNVKGVAEQNYELLALPQEPPKLIPVDQNIDNNNPVEGTSISFNCYVAEPVLAKVQWLRNGQIISQNNRYKIKVNPINSNTYNYILTINDISSNEAGNYKCRVNSVESPEFTVNVKPAIGPTISDFENENEITLQPGENKDIPCKANGSPKPTITWKLPRGDCNKNNFVQGETLYLRNVNCPGRYKCIVTNSKGSTEKEFSLSIVKPKVFPDIDIETDHSDNTISEYDDIVLVCLVEAGGTPQPYWEFNNKPISNNNKYKLVKKDIGKNKYYYNLEIKNIAILDRGNYKCRVGSSSTSVNVDVQPATIPKIDAIPDPKTNVEEGTKDFRLECKVSGTHPNVVWTYTTGYDCKYEQTVEDRGDHKVAVLTIKEVHLSCKSQYKCKVNNKRGGDEKVVDLNVVTLQPPPQPETESSTNNEAIENEEITLRCLIRGAVKSKPRWVVNGNFDHNKYRIDIQNITDTSYWYNLVIKDLKPEDGGNYKCVIGNYEQSITVNVKPSVKPTIEYISNTQTINTGKKHFRIACQATGSPKPKTTWVKNGNFDGCQHQITRDIAGNNEMIYLTIFDVTPTCTGRYTCVATNSKGESRADVDISVISVDGPPQVDIETSFNNEIIENEDVTLKCFIKAHTFEPEWIHQGQVVRTNNKYRIETIGVNQTSYWFNLIISNISPQEKGSYKCRVNNFESEVLVNVKESTKPVFEDVSNPSTIEEGKKDVTLSCKVSGTPKPKVHWYYEGRQINKNQFSCQYTNTSKVVDNTEWLYLTIRDVEQSCAGKYKCIAENSKGREENEVDLSVVSIKPPEIIQPPKNVFENSNVTLQCLIKGSVDSKPIWLHNNQQIDLNKNNKYKLFMIPLNDGTSYMFNLEILNISPRERGSYKCKINNLVAEVLLQPQAGRTPQFVRIPPPDLEFKEGTKQVTLPCEATGDPIPEITWLYENLPINPNSINNCQYRITTEQTGDKQKVNLIIQNVSPSCAGKYKCSSTNLLGTIKRDVNIRVTSIPPPFIEAIPTEKEIVENGNVTLKCLVPKIYTAEWYIKDEPLIIEPNSRFSIDVAPGNDTTNYWYNLVISNLLPSDKGQYKCKINNSEGIIELVVKSPAKPIIKYISAKDTIASEGAKDFKLACKVSGVPKPHASWEYEDNSVTSQYIGHKCKYIITSEVNGNSEWIYLTIAEVIPSCSGTYKCITKNSVGSEQKEINLSVSSTKQTIQIITSSSSTDGVNREHDDVILKCLSSGKSKVEWYHNKRPIDFQSNNRYQLAKQEFNAMTTWTILTIKNITLADKGDYSCRVNNAEQTHYLEVERGLIPQLEYSTKHQINVNENTERTILPCKVSDASDYVAEWTFNGKSIGESSCSDTAVSYEKTRHFEWYNLTITNITSSCSGQYKCIIRNLKQTDNSGIHLTVLPSKPPQIIVPDKTIREKDSVTLKCLISSSNTNAAKWTYKGNVITTNYYKYKISKTIIDDTSYYYNLEILEVSPQESGEYKCITETAETTHTLDIEASFKPIIEDTSEEMIVEEGTKDVTIFCKVKGSPPPAIKWYHQTMGPPKQGDCTLQSNLVTNPNSQTIYATLTNLIPSCSGRLLCAATNSKGYAEEYVDLKVMPIKKPEITINSTSPDNIIREGDDVTFNCITTGNTKSPWIFKSKYGDKNENLKVKTYEINSLTYRHEVVIKNIALKQAGTYTCQTGAVGANAVKIDIEPAVAPTIEKSNSENVVIFTNTRETTLFCQVSGSPRPKVTWYFQNKPIDLSNQAKCKYQMYSSNLWSNLTIKDASTSCAGYYKCEAINLKGGRVNEVTVRVIPPEEPKLTIKTDSTDIIKENDKVTLRCLVKGDINTPVLWLHNGQNIKIDNINHKITKEKDNDITFWYNLEIKRITFAQGGRYHCKTSSFQSNPIDVNVQSTKKPTMTLSPSSSKVFVESGAKELTLSCLETGVPMPSGTWKYNDIPIDKLTECSNSCQYKLSNTTNLKAERLLQLTLTNIIESCSGKYKCIAENSAGKAEEFVEVVVIPPGQPEVSIREPVHAVLNKDVTIPCEVRSVDQPTIHWKYNGRTITSTRNKYVITKGKLANNLHYTNLTIINYQHSDYGDYTCEGNLHNLQNVKTISLEAKTPIKPRFVNFGTILDEFKIIGNDLVLITKVKAYPVTKLQWTYDDLRTIDPDNTKYLSESSYISGDYYWFNQTIKNIDITDEGVHGFTLKKGDTRRNFFVKYEQGNFGVNVYDEPIYDETVSLPPET